MAACLGGWSLDAFDVQIYSVVIPTVIALWEMTTLIRFKDSPDPPSRRQAACCVRPELAADATTRATEL
jgi:hypothetical protein